MRLLLCRLYGGRSFVTFSRPRGRETERLNFCSIERARKITYKCVAGAGLTENIKNGTSIAGPAEPPQILAALLGLLADLGPILDDLLKPAIRVAVHDSKEVVVSG